MRPVLASLVLVLTACTTNNPWFVIDDGPDGDISTGPGATVTGSTSSSVTDGTGPGPTTGRPTTDTSDATSVAVTSDASSSTEPIDPSTSSSGSSETGDPGSSSGTTAADSSTDGTTDGTTGEPVIGAYYSLYPLCPVKETVWSAGVKGDMVIPCLMEAGEAPEVLQQPEVIGFLPGELPNALEVAPNLDAEGAIVGVFGPFTLEGAQQLEAQLLTGLLCATTDKVGSCAVNATVWVRSNGQDWLKTSKQVTNGVATNIILTLYTIPGVNSGDPFEVYLRADVGAKPDIEDRLWFIDPRISPPGG